MLDQLVELLHLPMHQGRLQGPKLVADLRGNGRVQLQQEVDQGGDGGAEGVVLQALLHSD